MSTIRVAVLCAKCDGTGKVPGDLCSVPECPDHSAWSGCDACRGSGAVVEARTAAALPPGERAQVEQETAQRIAEWLEADGNLVAERGQQASPESLEEAVCEAVATLATEYAEGIREGKWRPS